MYRLLTISGRVKQSDMMYIGGNQQHQVTMTLGFMSPVILIPRNKKQV